MTRYMLPLGLVLSTPAFGQEVEMEGGESEVVCDPAVIYELEHDCWTPQPRDVAETVMAQDPWSGDKDGDGVENLEDDCLFTPGTVINHGCPEGVDPNEDVDNDDVPDDIDRCPDERGVNDATSAGCPVVVAVPPPPELPPLPSPPEPGTTTTTTVTVTPVAPRHSVRSKRHDDDEDGFLNRYDVCPWDMPETVNGYADADGCPDEVPPPEPVVEIPAVVEPPPPVPEPVATPAPEPEPVSAPEPPPESDQDNDGVPDDEDACPDEPGTAEKHGCPVAERPSKMIGVPMDLVPNWTGGNMETPGRGHECPIGTVPAGTGTTASSGRWDSTKQLALDRQRAWEQLAPGSDGSYFIVMMTQLSDRTTWWCVPPETPAIGEVNVRVDSRANEEAARKAAEAQAKAEEAQRKAEEAQRKAEEAKAETPPPTGVAGTPLGKFHVSLVPVIAYNRSLSPDQTRPASEIGTGGADIVFVYPLEKGGDGTGWLVLGGTTLSFGGEDSWLPGGYAGVHYSVPIYRTYVYNAEGDPVSVKDDIRFQIGAEVGVVMLEAGALNNSPSYTIKYTTGRFALPIGLYPAPWFGLQVKPFIDTGYVRSAEVSAWWAKRGGVVFSPVVAF